jgi:putative oxidoreductase
MKLQWLIDWAGRAACHLAWLAPLFARITVGWVFLRSGWGKLHSLPQVIENFIGWGIPAPHLLAPFVSAVEFFGGLFFACRPVHAHFGRSAWGHDDCRDPLSKVG